MRYDKAAIREAASSGMTVKDIMAKFGCSDASVYRIVGENSTPRTINHNPKNIDWVAVQAARNTGRKSKEIISEFGISSASFYTKTKPAGGAPVIRSRRLLKPTPSPFEGVATEAVALPKSRVAKNGNRSLVDEIKSNLRNALDTAVKERNNLVTELTTVDRMIARLEKAVQ